MANKHHDIKPDHTPFAPCPVHQEEHGEHECHGEIKLHCPHHCPQLHSHTHRVTVAPMAETALATFELNIFNSWENAGYVVLAHSIVDTGAGWLMVFTVGWYA